MDPTRCPKHVPTYVYKPPPVDRYIEGPTWMDIGLGYPILDTRTIMPIYNRVGNIERTLPLEQWPGTEKAYYSDYYSKNYPIGDHYAYPRYHC